MRRDDGTLAGLGFGERDSKTFSKRLQGRVGARVFDPAAADDQRRALALHQCLRISQHRGCRQTPVDAVHAFLQEVIGVIVSLSLHVLGQSQGHGAGFGRVGQYAHGVNRGAHQLLGAVDPVPVLTHRLERIVGADAQVVELLDLLQHRVRLTAGVHIARQQ